MNQLTGRFVVIVLSIKEGRGFTPSENTYYLEANLSGRSIQSDPVTGENDPLFCTELVWEVEKKEIRKLRSSHVPLRVECYSIDEQQCKEKIGFILLHLRSARPLPRDQPVDVDFRWHKLLGVHQDYKALHPEISLTLTIRDKLTDNSSAEIILPTQSTSNYKTDLLEHLQVEPTKISVVYSEEGFIQIGDGSGTKGAFTLSFFIESAFNLDLLLSKNIFPENEFCITLTYFDLTINTKPFYKDLHEPIVLNDKITFKLFSTIEHLLTFFEQYPIVSLNFCQGTEIHGIAEINFRNFKVKDFFIEGSSPRTKYEQDCIFRATLNGQIPEAVNGRKPFVSTETSLQRTDLQVWAKCDTKYVSAETTRKEALGLQRVSSVITQMELQTNAGGDLNSNWKSVERSESAVQTTARTTHTVKSIFTQLKDVSVAITPEVPLILRDETYKLYCLTTTFNNIIWRRCDALTEGFQFRFCHPKANTVLIVQCNSDVIIPNEIITLENVTCKQYFVSTLHGISTLVYTYPPKVTICNGVNKVISEEFELYTKLFLTETHITENNGNCTYFAMIGEEGYEENIICELQIDMNLMDMGNNLNDYKKSCYDLEPIVLDERLTFRTLAELQSWKQEQQEWFNNRQKYLEQEKLKVLKSDWEIKRMELEQKLNNGIEKCRVLSEELITAANELEFKKKAYENNIIYPETQENIEIKVTQMLEAEMNKTVEKYKQENIQLMEHIENIELEKGQLNEMIGKKEVELDELKRTTLTTEQTSCLLQELRSMEEKYRQELTAKAFFKEQWQKAVREVHMLKSEDQKKIQMQIRTKKNELSQLSLEHFDEQSDSSEGSTQSLISCPSGNLNSCVY